MCTEETTLHSRWKLPRPKYVSSRVDYEAAVVRRIRLEEKDERVLPPLLWSHNPLLIRPE